MQIEVQPVTLTDPKHVADIFADGLGQIECVAGEYNRYVLYASNRGGGMDQRVVVARIIVPKVAVPAILMFAARQLGLALVRRTGGFINGTLH